MTGIYKVVKQGECFQVSKTDGTVLDKCNIVLQEFGSLHANKYVASILGSSAREQFNYGDIVAACLRFDTHEYQDRVFQEVTISEICKL